MNLTEKTLATAPDLLGRFSPSPQKAYLRLQDGGCVLLETNDSQLISLALIAGARIARRQSRIAIRWKLLRDWRQPIRPVDSHFILEGENVIHVSFGSGSWLGIDTELKEAFGFFGREVTRRVFFCQVFPLLIEHSRSVQPTIGLSAPDPEKWICEAL